MLWEGRRWEVPSGRTFAIGRDEGHVDLPIGDDRVSRRHALLSETESGWVLTDQSRNGTYVDGRRITRHAVGGTVTVAFGAPTGAPTVAISPVGPAPKRRTVSQGSFTAAHRLGGDRGGVRRCCGGRVGLGAGLRPRGSR